MNRGGDPPEGRLGSACSVGLWISENLRRDLDRGQAGQFSGLRLGQLLDHIISGLLDGKSRVPNHERATAGVERVINASDRLDVDELSIDLDEARRVYAVAEAAFERRPALGQFRIVEANG